MGQSNSNSQGFNPNFNMQEYNSKLNEISGRYAPHNMVDHNVYSSQINVKENQFTTFQRKNAIYKDTARITVQQNGCKVSFDYYSILGCQLQIYIGVREVIQHENRKTISIDSQLNLKGKLELSQDKLNYTNIINGNTNNLKNGANIIRIFDNYQKTEYVFNQNNKPILQKFEKDDKVYQIKNIFQGDKDGQDCSICLCNKSNILFKPCYHICICQNCAKMLDELKKKCPICRKNIFEVIILKIN